MPWMLYTTWWGHALIAEWSNVLVSCNQAGYSGARVRLNISVYCLGFASQYRALWLPSAAN